MTIAGLVSPKSQSTYRPKEVRPGNCEVARRRFLSRQVALLCPDGHGVQRVIDIVDVADKETSYIADAELHCGCVREVEVSCRERDAAKVQD